MELNNVSRERELHDAYNSPSAASDAIPIERLRRGELRRAQEIDQRSVQRGPLFAMLLAVLGALLLVGVLHAAWPAGFGAPMLGALAISNWATQDGRFPLSGGFFAFIGCIFSTLLTLVGALSFGLAGIGPGISVAFVCLAASTYLSFAQARTLFRLTLDGDGTKTDPEHDA